MDGTEFAFADSAWAAHSLEAGAVLASKGTVCITRISHTTTPCQKQIPPGSAGPQALLSNMVDPCPACRAVLAIRRPRLLRLGRGMIMPPASAEGVGAVRGSCSRASLVALRLSACGQLAVAVRLIGPASQPAGGAHIRDGACALGPCPWEVPMQSPKPKAARRFPVPYGF